MAVERGLRAAARPARVPRLGGLVTPGCGQLGVVLLVVGTAGCTMCPDLFDYAGPVPNGAVTQNDFCARSNGILPIGRSPTPWPTVVHADRDEAERDDAGEGGPAATEPVAAEPADADSVLRIAEVPELPKLPKPNVADGTQAREEPGEVELEESEVR